MNIYIYNYIYTYISVANSTILLCDTFISTFGRKYTTAPAQKNAERNVLTHFQHRHLCAVKKCGDADYFKTYKSTFINTKM